MPVSNNTLRKKGLTDCLINCIVVSEICRGYYASELQYIEAQGTNLEPISPTALRNPSGKAKRSGRGLYGPLESSATNKQGR